MVTEADILSTLWIIQIWFVCAGIWLGCLSRHVCRWRVPHPPSANGRVQRRLPTDNAWAGRCTKASWQAGRDVWTVCWNASVKGHCCFLVLFCSVKFICWDSVVWMNEWVGFNGTSTQFRSLAPSLTRKAGTESPTVKESWRYINLANTI